MFSPWATSRKSSKATAQMWCKSLLKELGLLVFLALLNQFSHVSNYVQQLRIGRMPFFSPSFTPSVGKFLQAFSLDYA